MEFPHRHGAADAGVPSARPDYPSLGQHVLARGVIFVDLALAQIAALGQSVAFLLGAEPHDPSMYLLVVRIHAARRGAVQFPVGPQPLGAAGGVHRDLVRAGDRGDAAAVVERARTAPSTCAGPERRSARLGDVEGHRDHGRPRRDRLVRFSFSTGRSCSSCSEDPKRAREAGLSVKKWDFLFYASFGLVVTSSVKVAGVLAVFSYLIVPLVCSTLLGRHGAKRLYLGLGDRTCRVDSGRRAVVFAGLADGRDHRVPVRSHGCRDIAVGADEERRSGRGCRERRRRRGTGSGRVSASAPDRDRGTRRSFRCAGRHGGQRVDIDVPGPRIGVHEGMLRRFGGRD